MRRTHEPHVPAAFVPDNILTGAVREALTQSSDVDTRDLLVKTSGGVVYLMGAVRTLYEKRAAGRLARATKGVKDVENDLVVVPGHQPADEQIKTAIDQALGNYPEGNPARIGVRLVQQGLAYLAGKASSVLEAWDAIDIASKINGVKGVISDIDIAPGYPMDDTLIKNMVIDALSEDTRVDPFGIEVHVEEAQVYLTGEVEDKVAVRAAGELASGTAGVKQVINHLIAREQGT
jgi:osmotically-inducible protein OsmY